MILNLWAATRVRRGLVLTCVLLAAATSSDGAQQIPGIDIVIRKTPGGQSITFADPILPAGVVFQLEDFVVPIPFGSINTTRSNAKGGLSMDAGAPPLEVTPGNWELDSFFDITYSIELEGPGVGGGPIPFIASGTAHVSGPGVTIADRNGDGSVDLADETLNVTEGPIHQFDVSVLSLELADSNGIRLRESPTLLSSGQILRRDLPDGQFVVASFFDVFVEMSLDGGATWTPANSSVQFQTVVPEPASLLLAVLAASGLICARRRRR